jgi:DNA invertase Pin-like site-specific DNA recombinase
MATLRAIGYVRVSTDEQAQNGHGLDAQRKIIEDECERRGWALLEIVDEGEGKGASGKSFDRVGIQRLMARMDRHEADVLVVAKLDRLSRSLAQGAAVMEAAARKGWSVVGIDMQIDTSTPAGELVANTLLSAARFQRRLIGELTKTGLAAARDKGVRLGRPQSLSADVVRRIVAERNAGRSLPKIAAGLTTDGTPTARGGATWYPSTIHSVLRSQAAATLPEGKLRKRVRTA